ncbi:MULTISPECIES: hypothetical protein [Actinoalloteichus]|nr:MULTISPECIES: hypothetical protein [Actinoalloteichus]
MRTAVSPVAGARLLLIIALRIAPRHDRLRFAGSLSRRRRAHPRDQEES